jgi:hypothetical protein
VREPAWHDGNLTDCRTHARSDAWNLRHRDEGPLRRADRNFAELLQELRPAHPDCGDAAAHAR